ncbi:MAG: cysteine desulfurase NifS [Clostridiales bacterium]|jgi:cysteine desulfurase|nr:cysteine desulfurase NifS [Clostridiales bacterium]
MARFVYADNAATTPVSEKVLQAMLPYFSQQYGNPSSLYSVGREAKKAVEQARETVARCLNAQPNEIFFTSGGSEADNWAIKGAAYEQAKRGKKHIITSKFEHHAVLHTVESLAKQGFSITYLDVHSDGLVRPEELEQAIREDTALVTIMYANNEIGTIQPVEELGAICKRRRVLFHTDAVQAVGNVPIDVEAQHIDLLSLTAHKLHGPKGAGALYVRRGVKLQNLVEGGAQERGRRAGTENTAGIVGLGAAMAMACDSIEQRAARLSKMRDRLIEGASKIDRAHLNGDPIHRLPGNVNMCFEGIEGESLLLMLDLKGICGSSGSACTSGSLDPSHVLLAIGLPHEIAHGSLRLSLSDQNSDEDVDYILEILPPIVERLRQMSPLWEKIVSENRPPYRLK